MGTWMKRSAILALAVALSVPSIAPAAAEGGRGAAFAAGVAAGIIGLGILGEEAERERAYSQGNYGGDGYGYGPSCHPGPLECRTYDAPCYHNDYGEYVCPPPERHCFRREICD